MHLIQRSSTVHGFVVHHMLFTPSFVPDVAVRLMTVAVLFCVRQTIPVVVVFRVGEE